MKPDVKEIIALTFIVQTAPQIMLLLVSEDITGSYSQYWAIFFLSIESCFVCKQIQGNRDIGSTRIQLVNSALSMNLPQTKPKLAQVVITSSIGRVT